MSSQDHSGVFSSGYMARIAQIAPSARPAKIFQVMRSKRHSIEDARNAVADKLLANLAYLRDPDNVKRPDLVYKFQWDGLYALGLKYGNRWLENVFNGDTYLQDVTADALCELLKGFAEDALAGQFDAYIQPIMAANIKAKNQGRR